MRILWYGGVTRTVILTKHWAIKLPCLIYGWKFFLFGLLANMQEVALFTASQDLCPVRFSLPGGFLIIMPRCRALTDTEFAELDYAEWIKGGESLPRGEWILPVEEKICSFGWLHGRIVAVDYGGCGRDEYLKP